MTKLATAVVAIVFGGAIIALGYMVTSHLIEKSVAHRPQNHPGDSRLTFDPYTQRVLRAERVLDDGTVDVTYHCHDDNVDRVQHQPCDTTPKWMTMGVDPATCKEDCGLYWQGQSTPRTETWGEKPEPLRAIRCWNPIAGGAYTCEYTDTRCGTSADTKGVIKTTDCVYGLKQ